MRRCRYLLFASSVVLMLAFRPVYARPRYGGLLRVETHSVIRSLDPGSSNFKLQPRALSLVFETLVRFNEAGIPEGLLATTWQHDRDWKRWQFQLRADVHFHGGTPLTPAAVVAGLNASGGEWVARESNASVIIESDRALPDLLWEISILKRAIVLRGADGAFLGTGPFQITEWRPGQRLQLGANESYWGGRPFLDGVVISMGRSPHEQLIDLELGRADMVELSPQEVPHTGSHPFAVGTSAPLDLIALVLDRNRVTGSDAVLRKSLAQAIDRSAINSVLLQKRGEVAEGLLPGWLSGYAFLLNERQGTRTVSRPGVPVVRLTYESRDPLLKAIAERVALDARTAGISIQIQGDNGLPGAAGADMKLVRVKLTPSPPSRALADLVDALSIRGLATFLGSDPLDVAYAQEKLLLESYFVIPLVHLPELYAVSPRVRHRNSSPVLPTGAWRFEDAWLQ